MKLLPRKPIRRGIIEDEETCQAERETERSEPHLVNGTPGRRDSVPEAESKREAGPLLKAMLVSGVLRLLEETDTFLPPTGS